MIRLVKIFLTLFTLLIMTGCTPPVLIPEYRITINGIDNVTAKRLQAAIEKKGYLVKREREYTKDLLGEYEINTQTFVIKDPNKKLTFDKVVSLSRFVLQSGFFDDISLKSVQHYYRAATGEGSVKIILYITLPPDSKACFKKNRKEIKLIWDPKEGKHSFTYYNRHRKEEYIDIYFVPKSKSCRSYTPKTFRRIYLSYPYEMETRPWRGGFILPFLHK
ncbi:MAG: hypothetical protein GXO31_00470 [Epsilonproteobacteria bacterium]|nr:hypothetical protein [Campylobacterota bacterium]